MRNYISLFPGLFSTVLRNKSLFPGLYSTVLGFVTYEGVSALTSRFKSNINEYIPEQYKMHYDAAASFCFMALMRTSISVNLFFLADHYITRENKNSVISEETKKKWHLGKLQTGIGLVAIALHTQEMAYAFRSVLTPALSFGAGKALTALGAKCTSILSAGTPAALGMIGVFFVAPVYFINKSVTQTQFIESDSWSYDRNLLILAAKEVKTGEEAKLVNLYKSARELINDGKISLNDWLQRDPNVRSKTLKELLDAHKAYDFSKISVEKNSTINNFLNTTSRYANNAKSCYIAMGIAGGVALFAPSTVAIGLVLASACISSGAAYYSNHLNARYAGEINILKFSTVTVSQASAQAAEVGTRD